jgi:tetratricopeptide (TPR) repeat protein
MLFPLVFASATVVRLTWQVCHAEQAQINIAHGENENNGPSRDNFLTLRKQNVRTKSIVLTLLGCLPLVAVVAYSHEKIASLLQKETVEAPQTTLPPPEAVKLCAMGYDQLVADWYWLSFVQYIGDSEGRSRDKYAQADKYLDLIVGLDPKFVKAYWFAAFVVGGDQKQPELAAKFIDRGIEANPNNWYLPFIGGINQYLFAHNDLAAAKYYRMASKFPGAPDWLGRQAQMLEAHIPSFIKEINTWDNIYRSTKDPLVKEKARAKLIGLWDYVRASAKTDVIKNKAQKALDELEQ